LRVSPQVLQVRLQEGHRGKALSKLKHMNKTHRINLFPTADQ